jgi:putative ABC transport system permease protein
MTGFLEALGQDVRLAVRSLLRSPGTTAISLIVLALGLGASVAIFSVAAGTLLRSLPVREPDRLVTLWERQASAHWETTPSALPTVEAWRRSRCFAGVASASMNWLNVSGPGAPEVVPSSRTSPDFFDVAGANLVYGRGFRPNEVGASVAVISDRLFRQRFGGDQGRLRGGILLDGKPYRVVGVAPPGFDVFGSRDVWIPGTWDPARLPRGMRFLRVLARLAPGVNQAEAAAELERLTAEMARRDPEGYGGWGQRLVPLRVEGLLEVRRALRLLGAAVSAVLLIACANVGGVMLVRASSREREMALRFALGARRLEVARGFLIESAVLFLAGGSLGLLLAVWGTPTLVGLAPPMSLSSAAGLRVARQALLFGLATSLAAGLLSGLIPAVLATRVPLSDLLKDGSRKISRPWRRRLGTQVLIAGQVALTLVLTVAAGLLLRSFSHLREVDPGFDPTGLAAVQVRPPLPAFPTLERRREIFQQLLGRVQDLPGILDVALVDWLPFDVDTPQLRVTLEGCRKDPNEVGFTLSHKVTPRYFPILGIPLLRGRPFGEDDRVGAPPVVIINQSLADFCWPGQNPVGRRFAFGAGRGEPEWTTVVGVVGDTRQSHLTGSTFESYQPFLQDPWPSAYLVVRGRGGGDDWVRSVTRAVRGVRRDVPVGREVRLPDLVAQDLAPSRFRSLVLGVFAALALVLAAVGIYGAVAYTVARRTHEVGVRMALGARPERIVARVVLEGMAPVLAGIGLGVAVAWPVAHRLAGQLYQVDAGDPFIFAVAIGVIAVVALVANYVPALRATEVNPVDALRRD